MKHYLFSAVHRCPPCRQLVNLLNQTIPNWKEKIEYVDVDATTKEQHELAVKLGVFRIPAFGTEEALIPDKDKTGYMGIYKQIKELCS